MFVSLARSEPLFQWPLQESRTERFPVIENFLAKATQWWVLEEFGVRMDAQMGNAQRQASLRGEFDVYCQDGTAVILAFAGLSNSTPALRVYVPGIDRPNGFGSIPWPSAHCLWAESHFTLNT